MVNEKRRPHYPLEDIRACLSAGQVRATRTAYIGAAEVGIPDLDGMCDIIRKLTLKDFYKSMTTYTDHTVWQDVYRPFLKNQTQAYLKLTIIEGLLIVSFKEK